jgi:UDP-N-acetylmuramoylalanine--D-glutamate ligase
MDIKNKRFLVVGTALSGYATAKFLLFKKAFVILTDIKSREEVDKNIIELYNKSNFKGIFGKQPPLSILEEIDYIIVSPGVPSDIPIIRKAKEKKIEVLSEIELAYRLSKTQIIAITGTNGKTTTTSLVGEIFRKNKNETYVVGNIGMPMISQIDNSTKNGYFIAEISSFQLEGIKYFKPSISAILNITPDHLNRHKTMDNYIAEKSKIFSNQNKEDITILNADDPITLSLEKQVTSKVIFFSRILVLDKGVFVEGNDIIIKDNHKEKIKVCSVSDIKMLGDHNLENALAATAICYYAGISIEVIKKVLKSFNGVSHRIEVVDTIEDIEFINDSKGTNPEASIKAIQAMKKPIILIAGGMDKGSDFTEFINSFNGKVKYLILLGETADIIEHAAIKQGFSKIEKVNSIENAVLNSFKIADKGDVVLLSPACASWDMFNSFEERGNLFKATVKDLRGLSDA